MAGVIEICEGCGAAVSADELKVCPWCEHTKCEYCDMGDDCECNNCKRVCGRCYDEVDEVFPANCAEKPEKLAGAPLGQYHCPDCGAMVMAGLEHPQLCKRCLDREHPGFDKPKEEAHGREESEE